MSKWTLLAGKAKPMRWASNEFSFIRPVHWLVSMHGSKVISGSMFGLEASNLTRGHRIHSPGPHEIATASDYEQILESACVVVDQEKRKDIIENQVIGTGQLLKIVHAKGKFGDFANFIKESRPGKNYN